MALYGMLRMKILSLLVIVILLVAAAAATMAEANQSILPQALPGCLDHCGNLTIPYPFGIGDGCYLRPEFNTSCYGLNSAYFETATTGQPRFITNISLQGELQIMQDTAYDCYNTLNEPMFRNSPSLSVPRPYTISDTENKFIVVGCDVLALFQGHRGDENYTTGCMSICDDNLGSANESCNGVGCCQTSIPSGLQSLKITLSSFYNHSYISNHCGYALIVQQDEYTFSGNKSFRELIGIEQLPMILNWEIGQEPCDAAENRVDYACKPNSKCVDRAISNGSGSSGYFCQCLPGYEGNPYLPDGCQDIDECKVLNPCNIGACVNSPGDYSCLCPKGYKHNGTSGKSCIKDNPSSNRFLLIILSLGISVGLFLVLLVGSLWMYWGLKKRKFIKLKEKYFTENGGLLLQQKLASRGGSVETAKIFTAQELEKATNNYHESRILGEGGYGTVYKGILLDNQVVAIKKSKVGAPTQTDQFVNEVIVLSQVNHRNVVKLLGCCLETEVPLLVYEFITQGTLFENIHTKKGKGSSLSWELRLKIASETAGALAYLHSSTSTPIIHRDVKAMNILLDDTYTAKVSDFGASRFIPLDQTQLATLVQGTFGYLDPEYFQSNQLTEKSDVYSFGVVLAELLTSKAALSFARPEAERCLAHFFVCSVEDGHLSQILSDDIVNEGATDQRVIENVANLAKRCLRLKGDERPTMKEVAMELEGMRIMTKHPWGSADHFCPEETEQLLGSHNTSKDYVVNVDGDGGSGTTSGFDSMQIDMLMSYADGDSYYLRE